MGRKFYGILTLLLVSGAGFLAGCVDQKYDLNNISTDNLVFGDEFLIPLANIGIDVNELFDFPTGSTGTVDVEVPSEFSQTFPIDEGFDTDLVDKLTGSGSMTLFGTIENPVPVELDVQVKFVAADGTEIVTILDKRVKAGETTDFSTPLTDEMLRQLSEGASVKVDFLTVDGLLHNVPLDPADMVNVDMKIKKTGGIKF